MAHQDYAYTGVFGHAFEPATDKELGTQHNELMHEGGGTWNGVGGYHRNSTFAYGFWDRQNWGWGDNHPYHYGAPAHHHTERNGWNYHHERNRERRRWF